MFLTISMIIIVININPELITIKTIISNLNRISITFAFNINLSFTYIMLNINWINTSFIFKYISKFRDTRPIFFITISILNCFKQFNRIIETLRNISFSIKCFSCNRKFNRGISSNSNITYNISISIFN